MAPLMDDRPSQPQDCVPRFLVVGAGSRGNAYARGLTESGLGVVAAVAEPVEFKRRQLGRRYIWRADEPVPEQEFDDWRDYLSFEQQRREDERAGKSVSPGIDAVFICIQDNQHVHAVTALAPLGLHVLCEKPLATTFHDCLSIQKAIETGPKSLFAIGHVLRYSPHNMMLRHLVREKKAIGDVISLEHTEPIGWWHFSHSYVRGYWRKEATSAPSLLTKSCHDIDFIMWMMCSPLDHNTEQPHLPSTISSSGSLKQFRRPQKPKAAGDATNCMSCPLQESCQYSAKRIYFDRHLAKGKALAPKTFWPIDIITPAVESLVMNDKPEEAKTELYKSLSEDYSKSTPVQDIESRPWFGRCVWESDNDVVDDQVVTFTWDDTEEGRGAKSAIFHMIAPTLAQCDRRGWIYGSTGEISYDSKTITVHDFTKDETEVFSPKIPVNSHHGGGDVGIVQQFAKAIMAVHGKELSVAQAQREYIGADAEEIIRSHAAVFAAEEARRDQKVVHWSRWWQDNAASVLAKE
ncbi:hypothetical protein AMS68_001095 [Peltaster fructicola]|uniref:Gfo/Idh/MocA-like oxidoreductase N-terminal domain-containing protein n=1 Tax=Peltaster fructicola TaxID=286661 RepID=A0A6H0XLT0_9PEZI|nr:hypothetical protein AMS68_001095 [Peltaster fructicola]